MLVLLLSVIVLLAHPQQSQATKPENKIVKNSASASRKETAKDDSKAALPPSDSQNVGVPSAPQKQDTKDGKNDSAHDRVYKVDIVTPPPKPLDTPLFSRYLLLTGIGIGVTSLGVFVNFLIWFSILKQTESNRIVATAAKQSADTVIKIERAWGHGEYCSRPRASPKVDWNVYGKARQKYEKHLRDPDDVFIQAEERRKQLAKQRKK